MLVFEKRLAEINRMYEKIVHSNANQDEYNYALAKLMTQMEIEFNIPALSNKEFEQIIEQLLLFIEKYPRVGLSNMGG
jgi:hypothetical protein